MADTPVIGHVIIACTRCGEPRHAQMTCESVPISRLGTYTWKVTRSGRQVGEMHLAFATLDDRHQCPSGPTEPVGTLRLIKAGADYATE